MQTVAAPLVDDNMRYRALGRIVVVDDSPLMMTYLTSLLVSAGFEVDAHENGEAALAACRSRSPDAVVSDMSMPGLNGIDLIKALRSDPDTAVIPVLLLSGDATEDARIAALAAGADDYLFKPIKGRELVARVDSAVRLATLRRETSRRQIADFASLFSLSPDSMIVTSPDGQILLANTRAMELFGYSQNELGQKLIEALLPEMFGVARNRYGKNSIDAPPPLPARHAWNTLATRKDGSVFHAEIKQTMLQFRNQLCTVVSVHDNTDRIERETERNETEARFRELTRHLVDMQEIDRRNLAKELHDRTSAGLAAIQINLTMLDTILPTSEMEDVRALLEDTTGLVRETTISVREISSDLRPTTLDDGGLLHALTGYVQQFTRRTGIEARLKTQTAPRDLKPAVQTSLFRIVQEALTNCTKHSGAGNVSIHLNTDSDAISLVIVDDGKGFDFDKRKSAGLGLLTMRERAEYAGGSFRLETGAGRGTHIEVLIRDPDEQTTDANPRTLQYGLNL